MQYLEYFGEKISLLDHPGAFEFDAAAGTRVGCELRERHFRKKVRCRDGVYCVESTNGKSIKVAVVVLKHATFP